MEAPPQSYLRSLGTLLSTTIPSQRLKHTESLLSILPTIPPRQAPLTATLTTQTISQLFTKDHITAPTEQWSRHPSHTEPLLEALLVLLCTSFKQPPPQSPVPSLASYTNSSADELSLSTLSLQPSPCYETIYPPPHPDLSSLATAFSEASKGLTLATAHLLHILTTLSAEPSTNIARLSYHTLASLTRILTSETRAAFLPGLISTLSKNLSHATQLHSSVCIAALDALHVIVSTLCLPLTKPNSQDYQTEQHPDRNNKHSPGEPRLSVIRDSKWIATASKQTAPRISHLFVVSTGPLHHSSPRVREYLSAFVSDCLRGSVISNSTCRALLRMSLISLAGDDFPTVRTTALRMLAALFIQEDITLHDFERCVRAAVKARGFTVKKWDGREHEKDLGEDEEEALKKLSSASDSVWARLANGCLSVLVPLRDIDRISVISSEKVASSVEIIGPNSFCRMLTELLSEQWAVVEDSNSGFVTALNCLVLRAAASLGRRGLLTSVFSTLVERAHVDAFEAEDEANLNNFREYGFAVLVLQAILRGEIRREDVRELELHQRFVYECTKETLQIMNRFFLPRTDALRSGTVDDDMVSLKHCLLVCTAHLFEDLADLHRRANIRPLGADITLVVLMSLLRDASSGEVVVRKTARETMIRISRAIGWKNERSLLLRHLNYIIGRVIRNLEQKWAGDVLGFIIGNEGDDVSREATVLLESTLHRMNESLAGASDERALTTMNSIINVLGTAVVQKQAMEQEIGATKSQKMAGSAVEQVAYRNDLSELRRILFTYCTEEVPNYDKLTTTVEASNKSFLENEGSDDDSNRDAFETIATHALDGTRDILVGRPWHVCASSLLCATLSVKLLKSRRRILLPFAAQILPLLPDQFLLLTEELTSGELLLKDFRLRKFGSLESRDDVEDLVKFLNSKGKQLPVVTNACLLLAAFAAYAGSFIRDRFVRLIYPNMRPLLRLAQCFPTLLVPRHVPKSANAVSVPSYGAMSACDACLEAIASVAVVAPDVLAPFAGSLVEYLAAFFDPKFDPATSPRRLVVHTNRSMVRFECERWVKRFGFAETIIRQLKAVNANDVLISLIKLDGTAPREIRCVHESLRGTMIV